MLLFTFSGQETRRDLVQTLLERGTGSPVKLGEPFRLELGRQVRMELHGLKIGEPNAAGSFYSADRVELAFPLFPLLWQRRLLLTLDLEKGRFRPVAQGKPATLPVTLVPVDIHVRDLQVAMPAQAAGAGQRRLLELARLTFGREGDHRALELAGAYDGLPLELVSRLGSPLEGEADRRSLQVSGRLGHMQISGKGWQESWQAGSVPALSLHLVGRAPGMRIFDGKLFSRLPEGGPVKVELDLEGGEIFRARNIAMEIDGANARVEARGSIDNLLDGRGLNLELQLDSDSPVAMLAAWGIRAPVRSSRMRIGGRLAGDYARLALEDLLVDVEGQDFSLRANGRVEALNRPRWLKVRLEGKGTGSGVPIRLALQVNGEGKRRMPVKLSLEGEGFRLDSKGELEIDERGVIARLSLQGSADSLEPVGRLLGIRFNPVTGVTLQTGLEFRDSRLELRGLRFRAGKSDLGGDLAVELREGRPPLVKGSLSSKQWDAVELHPAARKVQVKVVEGEKAESSVISGNPGSRHLFSRKPLKTAWLRLLEGEVELRFGRLRARHYLLEEFMARVIMDGHSVTMDGMRARLGGRPVTASFRLGDSGGRPRTRMKLDVDGADLSRGFPGFGLPGHSGTISIHLDVEGEGLTYAEVAASVNGTLLLGLKESPFGFGLPQELGRSLINRFNPVARSKPDQGYLECGAVFVEVRKGIARTPRGIVLRFPEVTWLGDGVVDLHKETLSIALKPHPRKGLGLSLKGLANLVAVGGTLASPAIVIDPTGALKTTLSYTAAVYTGGASLLLEGLWDLLRDNRDACGYVLHGEAAGDTTGGRGALPKEERPPPAGKGKQEKGLLEHLEDL